MVGVGLVFLAEFMDNTVKDEKFITDELGWTSLGRISEMSPGELRADSRASIPRRSAEPAQTRTRV